ncbi:DUF2326 domain-containing protein [Lachnospiraceae bacterium LCP25S3_G4]
MKILNLKILNPLDETIRNISFNEKGISFIYGDIQEPKNKKATINSLGKTLLLKFVDYILGANEDTKAVSDKLVDFKLKAEVLFKQKKYIVTRTIGDSQNIQIGNKQYTLTEYKSFFEIKRSLYSKQIILTKKNTEISLRSQPDKTDVVSCLQLLGILDILKDVEGIYTSQDRISDLKKQKKEIISFYGGWNIEQIDEEIYYVDKEVERLHDELNRVSKKIKDIEVSKIQQNVIEEYSEKSKELKKLKGAYENKRLECERLSDFIESSKKNEVTSEHILLIFEKVNQEIPEMVKRNLAEVEEFHNKVYEERKAFLGNKKQNLENQMKKIEENLCVLSNRVDSLGKVIATNEVYQESIELYGKYNSDLQELMYKQGKLSQVKDVDTNIEKETDNLTDKFSNAIQVRKSYDELVTKYRDFIYLLIQSIYDEEVSSYFDIKIRKKHLSARPVSFEFSLKGDTGEGVTEVKKNLMDYLLCRYNLEVEIMLQDSACYNGIDPRQVAGMLKAIGEIARETNKQVFIAINKYQIMGYDECIEYIEENTPITLSEKDKLLKFDF